MDYVLILLGFFGAVFGSFAGAQVWRLRIAQLRQDKKRGELENIDEYERLVVKRVRRKVDRSACLACDEVLKWYDLLPIVSWIVNAGKCRYCKKPIGFFELFIEVGMAAVFILSYVFWPFGLMSPLGITLFIVWLIALVILGILFSYDAKWFLLPDGMNALLAVLGFVFTVIYFIKNGFGLFDFVSLSLSIAIMSGIYLVLYIVSKGRWIGFGDVKLGVGLGFLLLTWQNAFLALFLANLIGTICILPLMMLKKISRTSHIPFGPFLIIATVISVLFGESFISWYLSQSLLLYL